MGEYVNSNLTVDENVVYETKLHWIIFGWVIVIGTLTGGIGLILGVFPLISYMTNEFAITDKRIMIKVGWLSRRTLELNLSKVESVSVDQSFLGRLLNYGTITVNGSGGTRESFNNICNPIEFRKAIMEVNFRLDERKYTPPQNM